jgi:hypothetical protein
MSNIIAICGAKRSGKDVLAKHIVANRGFKKLSFAEPLKKAVRELFNFTDIQVGIDEENAMGDEKDIIDERWGISPRKALQFFGTEIMQHNIGGLIPNTNRGFLADILLSHISGDSGNSCDACDVCDSRDGYVISDMRFLHEYNKLKSSAKVRSLIVIKINRPSINIPDDKGDTHISEKEYLDIPYDVEIVNDGTISDLTDLFDIFYDSLEGVALIEDANMLSYSSQLMS